MISVLLLWAACALGADNCSPVQEMKGPVPGTRELVFGAEARFESEIETITCTSIVRAGKPVVWVQRLHASSVGVVVERCVPDPERQPVGSIELRGSAAG